VGRNLGRPVAVVSLVAAALGSALLAQQVPPTFRAAAEADYRVELPVPTLAPGQYLLEIAASAGSFTARSDLRFQRR
jgi:hypothetical protein